MFLDFALFYTAFSSESNFYTLRQFLTMLKSVVPSHLYHILIIVSISEALSALLSQYD